MMINQNELLALLTAPKEEQAIVLAQVNDF